MVLLGRSVWQSLVLVEWHVHLRLSELVLVSLGNRSRSGSDESSAGFLLRTGSDAHERGFASLQKRNLTNSPIFIGASVEPFDAAVLQFTLKGMLVESATTKPSQLAG